VDLYAEQIGSPLREAQSFRMYFGGSPGNVAIGSSRLGLAVEMFSRVGADDLGQFLRETLVREGVGTRLLADDPDHLSGLVILGVAPPDRFPLIFYRENCADMETRLSAGDPAILAEAKALLVTGTGLSRPSTAEATMEIVREARGAGTAIVFDVDYRPVLWGVAAKGDGETRYRTSASVTATMQKLVPLSDLIVGTEEELKIAGGDDDVDAAIATLREMSRATIVCKRGVAGCSVFAAGADEQRFAGRPVEVLNVLGAGDAFLAGFLRGWLRGESFATSASWANANGALVVSRHGCAPAMGTLEEINWFLSQEDSRKAARSPELARLHRRAGRPVEQQLMVLAFDHRTQFESEADAAGVDRAEIRRLKRWIYEGFEDAVATLGNTGCALLLDPIYGSEVLTEATARGRRVGVPIESAGTLPTRWMGHDSAHSQILARPSRWFVKALFHLHPGQQESVRAAQLEGMRELQAACDALDRDLMLEIVEPAGMRYSDGDLPRLVGDLAAAGIEPAWWKLPTLSAESWRLLERELDAARSDARVVILGGGEQSTRAFNDALCIAAESPRAAGFAVGRAVFGDAMKAFFAGTATRDSVVAQVSERYASLVSAWRSTRTMVGAAH
jgi:5-dehydro-2-deoxygluconokinase